MRWVAGRWFGRGCYECDRCGEFPDLGQAPPRSRGGESEAVRIPPRRDDRPRVLLVDDSVEQRDLYALMLEPTASVITASRGEEALAIAREQPLDVVVLDVMMPGMDGWEVCRRLKEDAATRDIPVLLLTALDGAEVAAPGHRVGAAAVLMKPCPAERLAVAIDAAVRSESIARAAAAAAPLRRPRQWRRKRVAAPVHAVVNQSPARLLDVSYGGLRVEIDEAAEVAPTLDITFPAAQLAVRAEVVWKNRTEGERWLCGARVAMRDPGDAGAWRGLVDAISA